MKISCNTLDAIPETMLITAWARAIETEQNGGLLHDPTAVAVIKQIDYDFSVFNNAKMSQAGCCLRGKLIDQHTLNFIKKHPDAIVIQLGAGLDTRYQRLGCPNISHWYDLDVPEVIEIRQKLCPKHNKNTLLALSLFDETWIDTVLAHDKPVLIIIEGVLMYFDEAQVQCFFNTLCSRFNHATVLFDMLAYAAKGHAKYHESLKQTRHKAEFKWSLLNSTDMRSWNSRIHIAEELYMSDYAGNRLPLWLRLICKTRWGYRRFNQRILRVEIAAKSGE